MPVTIADLRRQGAIGILVRCVLPCHHLGAIRFDDLKLPEDTAYEDIPALKRIYCQFCKRQATAGEIAVDRGPLAGWGMKPQGG